jgi:hypothetical protein
MRPTSQLAFLFTVSAMLLLGGCVMAITPLHHQFNLNDSTNADKPPPQATTVVTDQEGPTNHKDRQDRKCAAGPEPVHDHRPIIPTFTKDDVKDKDAMNAKLIGYIKDMDAYTIAHQKREDDARAKWKEACHLQ